jgi:acetoacetyl-CoA synthetase
MSQVLDQAPHPGEAPRPAQLADFRQRCARLTDRDLTRPEDLYRWSVECSRQFWSTLLDWSELAWEGSSDVVCTSDDVETAVFFPDVRLNYAENLLRPLPGVDEDSTALTAVHGDGTAEHISRAALRRRVQAAATALSRQGVGVGDRVVVLAPNNARAVVTALAVAALGGTVSTGMPDMGAPTLLGRFVQVEPAVLVVERIGPEWAGRPGDTLSAVLDGLPTVRRLLVLDDQPLPDRDGQHVERLDAGSEQVDGSPAAWPRLPFNHPLFVMFSSGTTGPPKAMVHGAGGTLLEHVKEHRLHGDLHPDDTLYFHTTTAWMMWNWQLSALAVGAHVVVYDGPVRGPETLWRLVADHGVTVFGTSPVYLQLCQDAGFRPGDDLGLPRLRAVMSTGAVLHDWQFDWLTSAVGPVPLQSISGGTDIIGCFVLGHPELPVPRGRCQTRSLGLDVAAVDEEGTELVGVAGDLVCRNPFPSRPVAFLDDPDGRRFHAAYFADHAGMWTHGDLVDIAADGSARLLGRTDGVLNIDGVRIGPAEIYTVLRSVPEVSDAMAVEQRDPDAPGLSRLVLLVVLRSDAVLDAALAQRIRSTLRQQASAAHVPSLVLQVADLPITHNGKRSERAARDTLNGDPVPNLASLKNPESLDGIAEALTAGAAEEHAPAARPLADGDDLEAAISGLWREALGPDADAGRSFTDLGGTSRQAMTLLRQVRLTVGRDVLADAFLADPTLPTLIDAARNAPRATDAPGAVQLAPGTPGLPPLFLLHDAWGDIDVYWPVAQLLTGTGPVHGVRTDLTHPDGTRRRTILELAAANATEIQRTAPTGPLRLGGYSFGGLVAFETARLLADAGRQVDDLALLDVGPPPGLLNRAERLANGLGIRLALVVPSLREGPFSDVLRARFRPDTIPADRRVFIESTDLFNHYRPGRYTGPVTYLRARRRLPVIQNMLRAWRRVAPQLTVRDIPGAHHDMMSQTNIDALAATWSRSLSAPSQA